MSGLQHYEGEIQAVDARIARLALLCGADISRIDIVSNLIKGNFAVCTHANSTALGTLQELRALLMMKYRIEASCVNAIGAGDCARLIAAQDEKLRHSGFPPESLAP